MNVSCEKKLFQEASFLCEKTAGHKPTLPVLSAVMISTDKNKLKFISTNLETGLEMFIPAQIKKEGCVAVPAKVLSSFVSSLSFDGRLELGVVNNSLIVSTPNSSTTIKGYPVEDFPILPKIKELYSFTVAVCDFVLGLKSVCYSVSLSEMKPEINSVFVSSSVSSPLVFVGTDSFRLSEKTLPYTFSDFKSFLIPYRSAVEMLRVFDGRDDDLRVGADENSVVLESRGVRFTTRLVEGSFPNYKEIVPLKFVGMAVVKKRDFVDALKTTAMFCGRLNEVKMKVYPGDNYIEMQTNNPDLGDHTIKIPGKASGEDLSIVFNHRYLSDCLSSLNAEDVTFKFAGENRPLLISGEGDNSFRYLVMPMKNL